MLRYKLIPEHNAIHEYQQFHPARTQNTQFQIKGLSIHFEMSLQLLTLLMYRGSFESFPNSIMFEQFQYHWNSNPFTFNIVPIPSNGTGISDTLKQLKIEQNE